MGVLEVIGAVFILVGCVFALTGTVGVLRMPDFYSRLHPAGKSDTLAQGLILFGLALFATQQLIGVLATEGAGDHGPDWAGIVDVIIKLLLLSGLLFLTAPTATHAIAKAARLDRHYKHLAGDHLTVLLPGEVLMGDLDEHADDPGSSRAVELPVPGNIDEPLAEAPEQILDVHQGEQPGDEPGDDSGDDHSKQDQP
jgi:multicomponent Na+:H+ antiporter subunit G